jgi:hypothetical protein
VVINTENLTFDFGKQTVVKSLSLKVSEGNIWFPWPKWRRENHHHKTAAQPVTNTGRQHSYFRAGAAQQPPEHPFTNWLTDRATRNLSSLNRQGKPA